MAAKVKNVAAFVSKWNEIESRGRVVDYERAKLVVEWISHVTVEEVQRCLEEDVGLGPPRVAKVLRQAEAYRVVPTEAAWQALGWAWVGRLASVEDESDRARYERALMDAYELRGAPLTDGVIKDVLRAVGAACMLPGKREGGMPSGDLFKLELERLVRSGILKPDQVDPYVRKVGRFDEIAAKALAATN